MVFGRLTALRYEGRSDNGKALWICRCSCDGNERAYLGLRIRSGHTTSCGCYRQEVMRIRQQTQAEIGALARARKAVAKSNQPLLRNPVAIYELTDPRGLPWVYVGASEHPVSRYSSHCTSSSATNLKMQRWITELREADLRPNFRVRGWVEREAAGDMELQAIAEARRQFKRYCLNTKRSPAYGRVHESKEAPKSPKPTYGVCRTMECIQVATHSTGWCDSCYRLREAVRDEAKRQAGNPTIAPRGKGTGLCHDCRDPIPFNTSRCVNCRRDMGVLVCRPCGICGRDFKPYSTHPNEVCSDACREQRKNPLGLTIQERRRIGAKKAAKTQKARGSGLYSLSSEQRSANAIKAIEHQRETGTGFFGHTKEQKAVFGRKGGMSRQASMTPEQRKYLSQKARASQIHHCNQYST